MTVVRDEYIYVWTRVLTDWLNWQEEERNEWIARRLAGGEVQAQVLLHEPPIFWVLSAVVRSIVPKLESANLPVVQMDLFEACLDATGVWGPLDDRQMDIALAAIRGYLAARGWELSAGTAGRS